MSGEHGIWVDHTCNWVAKPADFCLMLPEPATRLLRRHGGRERPHDDPDQEQELEERPRHPQERGEAESRRAAILLAKKRRFGPFGMAPEDEEHDARRKRREKQVAAMLRAGHQYAHAGFILDAASIDDVEEWLKEAEDDEEDRFSTEPDGSFEQGSWD